MGNTRSSAIVDDKPITRCTCMAVRMTSRRISQIYDQALAPIGLRSGQYSLLVALTRIHPVGVKELGEALLLDRTTVGRTLQPLERARLISIAVDPADRRGRVVEITALGREILQEAEPLWAAAQQRLEQTFGAERTRALHKEFASLLSLTLSA